MAQTLSEAAFEVVAREAPVRAAARSSATELRLGRALRRLYVPLHADDRLPRLGTLLEALHETGEERSGEERSKR